MRSFTLPALLAVVAFSVTGCDSNKEAANEEDRAAIREAVLEFTQNPQPRELGENYLHVINTAKGQLMISSREWMTDKKGTSGFAGPFRATGYYLYPRMEWASNPEEATELLLIDYEAGNCAPVPEAVETKASDSAGPTGSQPDQAKHAEPQR